MERLERSSFQAVSPWSKPSRDVIFVSCLSGYVKLITSKREKQLQFSLPEGRIARSADQFRRFQIYTTFLLACASFVLVALLLINAIPG
jgi:hypothetical protein